jgi:hypothetical protein
VQSARDYHKAAAAFLSGQKPPKHDHTEQTIDDVCAHPEDRRLRRERDGGATCRQPPIDVGKMKFLGPINWVDA